MAEKYNFEKLNKMNLVDLSLTRDRLKRDYSDRLKMVNNMKAQVLFYQSEIARMDAQIGNHENKAPTRIKTL